MNTANLHCLPGVGAPSSKVHNLSGLSTAAADNYAVAEAILNQMRCLEWLAEKGYHVLAWSGDARGPRVTIAPRPRALTDLDGASGGQHDQGGVVFEDFHARKFNVLITWKEAKK